MITMKKQSTLREFDSVHSLVCVCSLHPLVAEILRNTVVAAVAFSFQTRVFSNLHHLQPRERGEVLFLDGCRENEWPKPALRWQKGGGRVLVLLTPQAAHSGNQLRALFLGIKGIVVVSGDWYNEVPHAIKTILEGRLWFNRDVLNEYVRRVTYRGKNQSKGLDPFSYFTAREEQIVSLLLNGDSNKEIGDVLGIAERTVKYHVSNILQKSQVSSRKQLLKMMLKNKECTDIETSERWKCVQGEIQAETRT